MEVMILLKLEVDTEQWRKPRDTDDDIKTKIRAYIADIVGHAIQQEYVKLISSSVAVETEQKGIIQIHPSNQVIKIDPDMKM